MTEATKHYPVGGSTVERIMLCSASRSACALLPPAPAGKAAERGTRIHALAEDIFHNRKPKEKPATDEFNIAHAMVEKLIEVATGLGFTKEELILEEQIAFTSIHPEDAGGTPDVAASRAFSDMLIADFKSGVQFVSAVENVQLIFYACAYFFEKLDEFMRSTLVNVHLLILQPDMNDNTVIHARLWTAPVSILYAWKERFYQAVANSIIGTENYTPGDHCEAKYCDARGTCAAYKEWLNKSTDGQLFDAIEKATKGEALPTPNGVQLAALLKAKAKVTKWLEAAEKQAIAELTANANAVPGYMLEPGQGNSVWADEKAVEEKAKALKLKIDDYKPRAMVGIQKFKALVKGKMTEDEVNALTMRPARDNKIVEKPETGLADFAPPAPPAVDFSSLV